MKRNRKVMSLTWIVLVLLFMYLPILVLMVYSFTDSTQLGAIRGFSLDNYRTLVELDEIREMIADTFVLAFVVAALSTILGTLGAIGAFYGKRKMRGFVAAANQIPVVNADVVTGFSICILLIIFLNVDKDTYIPLVIGHMALCTPFVYLSIMPKLQQMDPHHYEAAIDLGARPFQALTKVVVRELIPSIISGFATALTLSLDDYFITTYTKPAVFNTISTYVVNATKGSQTQVKTALWALSTVIFLLVVIGVALMNVNARGKGESRDEIM